MWQYKPTVACNGLGVALLQEGQPITCESVESDGAAEHNYHSNQERAALISLLLRAVWSVCIWVADDSEESLQIVSDDQQETDRQRTKAADLSTVPV